MIFRIYSDILCLYDGTELPNQNFTEDQLTCTFVLFVRIRKTWKVLVSSTLFLSRLKAKKVYLNIGMYVHTIAPDITAPFSGPLSVQRFKLSTSESQPSDFPFRFPSHFSSFLLPSPSPVYVTRPARPTVKPRSLDGMWMKPENNTLTPDTWAERFESFERKNLIRETNGNFD